MTYRTRHLRLFGIIALALIVLTMGCSMRSSSGNEQPITLEQNFKDITDPQVEIILYESQILPIMNQQTTEPGEMLFFWDSLDESTFEVYTLTTLPEWVIETCNQFKVNYRINPGLCYIVFSIVKQSENDDGNARISPEIMLALTANLVNNCLHDCPIGPGGTHGPWQILVLDDNTIYTDLFDVYMPWPRANPDDPIVSGLTAANIIYDKGLENNLWTSTSSNEFVKDFRNWNDNMNQAIKVYKTAHYMHDTIVLMQERYGE